LKALWGQALSRVYRQTFVILFLLLLGCSSSKSEKPSYLVIAVEKMPFTGSLCSQTITAEQSVEAFDLLCNEAIRFTHMFSPSTQSQAVMASLLTGVYPHEHKVWHNGNVYLNETYVTAAEEFVKQGWRTSFISGGAGIWRKSGLAQGFQYFDDSFPVHWNSYYRPARQSFDNFLKWLDENKEDAFFSVVYLPDLLFPSISTKDEEGVRRESTYEGQYRSLLDSIGYVAKNLKARDQWHTTNIIVMGLNGRGSFFRKEEIDAYNLYSENSQVAFYFKPSGKKRDLGHSWKVDYNYSIVDLGYSFFAELKVKGNESVFVNKNIFSKEYSEADSNRWIMVESGWTQWKNLSTSRFSLRNENRAFIFDDKIQVFNTLIDRLELNPQIIAWDEMRDADVNHWIQTLNLKPWSAPDDMKISKWQLAKRLWDPYDLEQDAKDFFTIYESTKDTQVLEWLATLAIKKEKWNWLLQAAGLANNPIWAFTAKHNLGVLNAEDWQKINDPCFAQFLIDDHPLKSRNSLAKCKNVQVDLLHKWIYDKSESKETYRELFIRDYLEKNLAENIYKLNYIADMSWDVDLRYPAGPSLSDLILSLNKFRTYYTFIKRRMEVVQDEKVVY
jgi:hypothetical protein